MSLLFAAFAVTDEQSFLRLPRRDRHHLAITPMQHSAAMRFGHFPARAYTWKQFRQGSRDASFRLMTDCHRYSGRHRYCLRFDAVPAARSRWYRLRNADGEVVTDVSAATVMSWHFRQLKGAGEQTVFAPSGTAPNTRQDRQE